MTTRSQYVEAARRYMDTPFHHQGRVRGAGVDCIGLLVCAAKDAAGGEPPDAKAYPRRPDGVLLKASLDAHLISVDKADVKPGDIVLFQFDGVVPQHVAIISAINPIYILHSNASVKKVTEHRMDQTWESRVVQFYRIPWLED